MTRAGLADRSALASEDGFSLIELMVVVILVGILAAIAIPNFLNQRSKAHDAHAKSAGRTAMIALEAYSEEHDGYLDVDAADLVSLEPSLGDALISVTATPGGYRLQSDSPSAAFVAERSGDGTTDRTCSPAGKGGCPQNGRW